MMTTQVSILTEAAEVLLKNTTLIMKYLWNLVLKVTSKSYGQQAGGESVS